MTERTFPLVPVKKLNIALSVFSVQKNNRFFLCVKKIENSELVYFKITSLSQKNCLQFDGGRIVFLLLCENITLRKFEKIRNFSRGNLD